MVYIEPRDVTIRTSSFEMDGVISGTKDSFHYESSQTHFIYWFPDGKIDSAAIKKTSLKREQAEIIEACENKMKELLG